MKDLEDLLPDKSLIPPPIEEEETAPPGMMYPFSKVPYMQTPHRDSPDWDQTHNLLPDQIDRHCTNMSQRYHTVSGQARFHLSDLNPLSVSRLLSQML